MSRAAQTEPTAIIWVTSPRELPAVPEAGRLALVDVAFAHKDGYERVTRPFIERAGPRLAAWIDHHEHPAWTAHERDARFVLSPRHRARACPELVTPELAARLGRLDHLLAHADFDGLVSAVKLLRGGQPPYPEADEDARAVDSPGRGFLLSDRGLRLARAMDQMSVERPGDRLLLSTRVAEALLAGAEPRALTEEIDALAAAWAAEEPGWLALADEARRPHSDILLLESPRALAGAQRKLVLCALEARARVAVLVEPPDWVAAGTFHDEPTDDLSPGLDLTRVRGLNGIPGYAYGRVPLARVLDDLRKLLAR
jgi:hypothetical protein